MEWIRGGRVGCGNFGTVNLAIPRSDRSKVLPLMAVKSCGASHSASLKNEKLILDELKGCPEIIHCFGDSFSFENGDKLYNVLLEYAPGGALAKKIEDSGEQGLPDCEVQRYTKSVLKGLHYIHKLKYVHCDIKLQNILLDENGGVKIADFGLSKKAGEKMKGELRGTPMYMSPEMVAGGEQEAPADIWALGCVVAEMVTGAPAWGCRPKSDVAGLLMRIGAGEEVPKFPGKLSEEGKDFLGKCFFKDPRKRWTAEMLLNHPFIAADAIDHGTVLLNDTSDCDAGTDGDTPSISPRSPFDFSDWVSEKSSLTLFQDDSTWFQNNPISLIGSSKNSPSDRVRGLVTNHQPYWSCSGNWVTVRQ